MKKYADLYSFVLLTIGASIGAWTVHRMYQIRIKRGLINTTVNTGVRSGDVVFGVRG
jgi:hypothetical protein